LRTCASKQFHPNGPAYSVEKAARALGYLEWKDKSFQVGVSIGVVVVTAMSFSGGEVMQRAESAAKLQGHGLCRTNLRHGDEVVQLRQSQLNFGKN